MICGVSAAILIPALLGVFHLIRSRHVLAKYDSNRLNDRRILATVPAAESVASPHVFISYSRHDADKVAAIAKSVEQAGYTVWLDTQSTEAAQRYAGQIVRAIRASKVVALMCSRNAFASDHVIREVYLAGDFKKAFVLFVFDDTEIPDDLLYFVTGFPRLNLDDLASDRVRAELARFVAA